MLDTLVQLERGKDTVITSILFDTCKLRWSLLQYLKVYSYLYLIPFRGWLFYFKTNLFTMPYGHLYIESSRVSTRI